MPELNYGPPNQFMQPCKWFAQAICTTNCDGKFCDAEASGKYPPLKPPAPIPPAAAAATGLKIDDTVAGPPPVLYEEILKQAAIRDPVRYEQPDDPVNHPQHYTSHPSGVECIQITRHMGFNLGNAIKYVWRADLKGDAIEDLKKAIFYIKDEIKKRGGDA